MASFFRSSEHRLLALFSFVLSVNTLLFVSREVETLGFLAFTRDTAAFYFVYAALSTLCLGTLAFFSKTFEWQSWLSKLLLVFFPSEVLLAFGLTESNGFHYAFSFAAGLYVILAGVVLTAIRHRKITEEAPESGSFKLKAWLRIQGPGVWTIVFLAMALNFSLGAYRLAQFAAVDEPLWTYGDEKRILRYWSNIAEHDWKGTRISDKPGITVALISGTGLLFENPKDYKLVKKEGGTERPKNDIAILNFALRLPILLFATLSLPAFYFLLERLFGREKALFSTVFVGSSPILLGMSRIINPDSVLWIFVPLSLLGYFNFLKRRNPWYLYWSGILLGLALLTKYVSNIVFIFFFGLIFLEYVFMKTERRVATEPVRYFKEALTDYVIVTFAALSTFYLLYPAAWIRPSRLLDATLLSQAFESTWPLFIGILSFLFLDQWILKNRLLAAMLDFMAEKRKWLVSAIVAVFFLSAAFVILDTYGGMRPYDFQEILASPKTAYQEKGFDNVFFANFYPLLFGMAPVALLLLFGMAAYLLRSASGSSFTFRASLYIVIFILLYYLGTTVNHVAAISRYQIIVFPVALVLAGVAAGLFLEKVFRNKAGTVLFPAGLALLATTSWSLFGASPLYLGYASGFLPDRYHIDIKDMGTGSYEAAAYLNSLPNPEQLTVWTDKSGLCTFFRGNCYSSFGFEKLRDKGLDYIVVSSGRKSRTTKMMRRYVLEPNPDVIRFDEYYDRTDGLSFKLEVDGRPGNYVKVFPFVDSRAQRKE
jgi:hypothetical protein